MASLLSHDRLRYSYSLIDICLVPAEPFLASDKPVEIILAVLCEYQNKDLLVERILQRLKETVIEELRLSKYIRQLEIFSQLRNLQDTVCQKKSAMNFIYDIEKDPVYKEGEKRGEEQGEKQKALSMAQAMKQAGEPIEKITAYTQLSREEVEKL